MGAEAYDNSKRAKRVFEVGSKITGIDLLEICIGDRTDELSKTEIAQPAISAASLAEFLYLEELGLRFDAGIGHSLGEVPLLAMAEVISIEGMFKIIKARANATAKASALRPGKMGVSFNLNTEQLEEVLGDLLKSGRLFIANFNSNLQHALSGDETLLTMAREAISKKADSVMELKGAKLKPLRIPGAFHSPYHMQPARRRFQKAASSINYSGPRFEIMLNNGLYLDELGLANMPNYLAAQLVKNVLFREGIKRLVEDGVSNFIQVGERPVLSDLVTEDYNDQVNIIRVVRANKKNKNRGHS